MYVIRVDYTDKEGRTYPSYFKEDRGYILMGNKDEAKRYETRGGAKLDADYYFQNRKVKIEKSPPKSHRSPNADKV